MVSIGPPGIGSRSKNVGGGLGFKDIQCFNLAFLAKIGWRLILNPESLLAKVMREKYHPGKTFREATGGRRSSWRWKGVLEARKVLDKGLLWRVGDGASISIREDPWFPMPSTFHVRPKENLNANLVCDLINPISRTWNVDMIEAGLNREEADVILSIPISRTRSTDRLGWFHTANGIYLVKTGYGSAMELMEDGALDKKGRDSTSEKTKHDQLWRSIWCLDVPSKMRFFIWKCCNHALAVRRNLKRRHMRVDNVCGVCSQVDETENHLFFRYETSHQFWFCSPLQLNSFELESSDFLQSWSRFCSWIDRLDKRRELLQEFVLGLWRLWKNINDVIFNRRNHQPTEILKAWKRSLAEYRNYAVTGEQEMWPGMVTEALGEGAGKIQWQKPCFGKIKINTDAAWCKETQWAGVGWVARDFAGVLQGAGGSGIMRFHSATAAEAAAIREALEFCLMREFESVIIESDAKAIVQMIKKELTHDFRLECLLGDIESLAHRMQSVAFVFVPRESKS